ncbi:PREDICTED: probable 39S ribosomal protein L45, mitochondrial [Priapulus caudatus]|uniref:Large ribosomal subunit protein mL45 n=1 Tax=Priapulus caudatus TaxID=37621 RepID=A0ABM1DTQ9_PRICU|nr:PREDICTED: probable 39S ribosomal protein L45, mitochondrial [Priapulus caudatus]
MALPRLLSCSQVIRHQVHQFPAADMVGQLSSLSVACTQVRHMPQRSKFKTKHYDPKWRKERAAKMLKIDLPDYIKLKKDQNLSLEEMRAKMKKEGISPPTPYQERPILITCTDFGIRAQDMLHYRLMNMQSEWTEAHISNGNVEISLTAKIKSVEDKLHELVTERAFPDLTLDLSEKTIRWKWIESLEPPTVTHVRQTDIITKENIYGQVTVRMHSKQMLAIYDRFGRLVYGSETMPKDVLEYVVFEKHLSDQYGCWRLHAKIVPEWMPRRDAVHRTFVMPSLQEVEEEEPKQEDDGSVVSSADAQSQPVAA